MSITKSAEAMRITATALRKLSKQYPALVSSAKGNGWQEAAALLERRADWMDDMVEKGIYANDCLSHLEQS